MCGNYNLYPNPKIYELEKFANMRGYVTKDELEKIAQIRIDNKISIKKETKTFEKNFYQKHGSDKSKWSQEINDKFYSKDFD